MYSVDLAFEYLCERLDLDLEVTRYAYGGPYRAEGLHRHSLEYASLDGHLDEALTSDVIVFWGDFLHARSYWRTGLRRRPGGPADVDDERSEAEQVARCLLLDGQPPEVLARTLSFGTTLLGDDLRSLTSEDTAYRTAFPAFASGVHRFWCRDAISAAQVQRHRLDRDERCLGVDPALLLTPDDFAAIAGGAASRGDHAAVYLGRVEAAMEGPARFTGRLLAATGLEARWLPWLGPGAGALDQTAAALPRLAVGEADTYEALIGALLGARLVVTDAYHLCLIAWRLGIPAVCVGVGAQRPTRPISDKKKEVFHLTQGLSPLYLFHEALDDGSRHDALVAEVLDLVGDAAYVAGASAALAEQARSAEDDLRGAIESLVP